MKYMGSKSRIAKYIVPIIQKSIDESGYTTYIEPFCGGCNVVDSIRADNRLANDINPYLIALYDAILYHDVKLPAIITREEYVGVRSSQTNYPMWYVGAVGFLASYNGKFFGGYSGIVNTRGGVRDYYDEAKRNLEAQIPSLRGIKFSYTDYNAILPKHAVIYCDPPYADTTGYGGTINFEHDRFWDYIRHISQDNIVFVSEHSAPDDFISIWERPVTRTLDNAKRSIAVEKLFQYKG